jgi:hypothetical protein
MAGNTLMVNPYGSFGSYQNSVALDSFYDDVFGSQMANGGSMFSTPMPVGTMPYAMPGVGTTDPYSWAGLQRNSMANYTAPETAVRNSIADIQDTLEFRTPGDFREVYGGYLADVKRLYPDLSERETRAMAKDLYERSTGTRLTRAIDSQSPGAFAEGALKGIPLYGWFKDQTTSADNIQQVTGHRPKGSTAVENTGTILSAAASGAAIGAGLGAVGLVFPPLAGITVPAGAIVGGLIGAVTGIIQAIRNYAGKK